MASLALRHVSVWLDEPAPDRGPFAHALEWAARFRLPLRAVAALPGEGGRPAAGPEVVRACVTASARQGVCWDGSIRQAPLDHGVEQLLQPFGLCVFGGSLSPAVREDMLRRSLQAPETAVLVCPPAWRPVSRVLVLHEEHGLGSRFLDDAAAVCRAFDAAPVVLTVGRSEDAARGPRRAAEEAFAAHGVAADFDTLVGCDVGTAVAGVARWRGCGHVFLEHRPAPSWWRWRRRDTIERLLGLSDSLAFLALPGEREALFSERGEA